MTDTAAARAGEPPLAQALVPVVLLVALLGAAVYLFGDESSFGPNQIALVLGTAAAGLVGLANGRTWAEIEGAVRRGVATSMGAILILLVVGSVIGAWILAGIVPTMIHYGLSLLAPSVFYAAACAICAVVALATGSSWTTAGTVGLALIGTAAAYDLHPGIAAGAIISGAYFGDKMSPLSDTTNLAPAVAGSELFTHVRHMVRTTAPSFGLALILFAAIGLAAPAPEGSGDLDAVLEALDRSFAIGPHLLLPLVLVLTLVARRMPAFPALLIGALVGGLFAVAFQPEAVLRLAAGADLPRPVALLKGVWQALHGGYVLESGNAALDELLSRGGMASMLQTVWLIMTAMMYGAVLEATGILQALARRILRAVRTAGGLILATLATSFGVNVLASDQYISIVLPGRMFRGEYRRRRLDPKNLSRTLEDSGTITSVLIPWNTCGAFMAQTLGVSTLAYAPFAFFNLINPLVAAFYGFARIGIAPLDPAAEPERPAPGSAPPSAPGAS